jgi:hypothetical protein
LPSLISTRALAAPVRERIAGVSETRYAPATPGALD